MSPIVSISNLVKVYPKDILALKSINLDINKGDFFGFLGPNGAGKSTTIDILSSLIKKTSGTIIIGGYDIDLEVDKVKQKLGIVPQEFNFSTFETVENIIINQAGYYGISYNIAKKSAAIYLKTLNLWDKKDTLAGKLSGGMKRRLMIARALVHDPEILILDEPTSGIDVEIRSTIYTFLRDLNKAGTTIILTTHYLKEAEILCNRIGIIDHGTIIKDCLTKELISLGSTRNFIITFANKIKSLPKSNKFRAAKIDDTTINIELKSNISINEVVNCMTSNKLYITNIAKKSISLEEMFLSLINK